MTNNIMLAVSRHVVALHHVRAGGGLRRIIAASSSSSSSSSSATIAQQRQQQHFRSTDPHSIANELVSDSNSALRTPGTESVATLTPEQRMSNFAMAGGLLAFVSYVFYYSLASVGGENKARALIFGEDKSAGNNTNFEDFMKEANEGRTLEEKKALEQMKARGDARELIGLEDSVEEESEMAKVAFADGESSGDVTRKRPLWKRVVFFWRRE